MSATTTKTLPVAELRIDGGTQPRFEIDEAMVAEYAEAMAGGAEFPPVVVFNDGTKYWLADGFHRTHAARRVNVKSLPAEIHDGTKRDAILYSVGANAAHGLRRSNADKRKAVMTLLQDEKWSQWTDKEIQRQCGIGDNNYVGMIRRSLSDSGSEPAKSRTYTNKHGTTSTMNTENIGKNRISTEYVRNGKVNKPRHVRAEEIAKLAAKGFTKHQISSALNIRDTHIHDIAKEHDIPLADQQIGKTRKVTARRVVEQTVTDLEGYAAGVDSLTADLSQIDKAEAADWAASLAESVKSFNKLKRNLTEISNG